MTKYTKLISFFAICSLVLFGFHFYQAQTQSSELEVELVIEEGQKEELDHLQFLGNAFEYDSYSSTSFEYKDGNVSYMTDLSLFKNMDFSFTAGMNRYIEDYRSFMRGKARLSNLFTETEDYLVYTGMQSDVNWRSFNDNSLTISLLNKETKEESTHEVLLTGGSYHSHSVVAAYIDYPKLTIAAQAADENLDINWLIYSFNLNDPEEELSPVSNLGRTSESSSIHFSHSQTKNERFFLFRTVEPGGTDEYDYLVDMIPTGSFIYDTQTEEVKELPSFEDGETVILTESDTVLVGNDLGDTIEWNEWDFEGETLTNLGTSAMITPTIGRVPVHYYENSFNQGLQLINGHIYAFEQEASESSSRPLFQVIEQDSLDTVFSGYFNANSTSDVSRFNIEVLDYSFDHLSR